jgi:hypothetical protein
VIGDLLGWVGFALDLIAQAGLVMLIALVVLATLHDLLRGRGW